MKLPIIRLIGREKLKVIYADKKWAFEKGIDYKDVHPSFSAHLVTLKDDRGNLLFEIDHGSKTIKVTPENSVEAINKDDALRVKLNKKVKHRGSKKTKPVKLNME